jgi:1-deoxy-D-xylulose-5-phosphate synthase
MPNMTIFVPKDESELRDMLYTAVQMDTPSAIRYPRGCGLGVAVSEDFHKLEIGRAECLQDGQDVAILAVGTMVSKAQQTAEILAQAGITAAVVNMRFVKPLDEDMLKQHLSARLLVTMEENSLLGGFGSAVAEYLADNGRTMNLLRLGLPDKFVEQGTQDELLALCGLQPEQMAEKIKERLK